MTGLRILHLIDDGPAGNSPAHRAMLRELIARTPACSHQLVAACRLDEAWHAAPPCETFEVGPVRLTRPSSFLALRDTMRRIGAIDCLHTLGPRAAMLARMAGCRAATAITLDPAADANRGTGRLARNSAVAMFTGPMLGSPPAWASSHFTFIPPTSIPSADENPAERLRIGAASEGAVIVVAIGDPSSNVDALSSTLVVGLARQSGRDVTLLLPPDAARLSAAHTVAASQERQLIVIDERVNAPALLAGIADVALTFSTGPSLRAAMAAGMVPLAADRPHFRQAIGNADAARFVADARPGGLARELCRLVDHPDAMHAAKVSARREAASGSDSGPKQWIEALVKGCHTAAAT